MATTWCGARAGLVAVALLLAVAAEARGERGDDAVQGRAAMVPFPAASVAGSADTGATPDPPASVDGRRDGRWSSPIAAPRRFGEVRHTTRPHPRVTVSARAFYDGVEQEGGVPGPWLDGRPGSHRVGGGLRARWDVSASNAVSVGSEYVHDPIAWPPALDVPTARALLREPPSLASWSLHGTDQWSLTPRLRLTAGVRRDSVYDGRIAATSGHGSLRWRPWDATAVRLLAERMPRSPLVADGIRVPADGTFYLDNPGIEPERVTTGEASLDQELWSGLRGRATLFRSVVDGLVERARLPSRRGSDARHRYRNTGAVEADGAELALRLPLPLGARAGLRHTIQHATRDGHALATAPRHVGGLDLLLPLPAGLHAGGALQLLDTRGTGSEPATIANLALEAPTPVRDLTLRLHLYDLFDATASERTGPDLRGDRIARDGRTLRVQLVRTF